MFVYVVVEPVSLNIHYVGTTDYPERRFHLHQAKVMSDRNWGRDTSAYYKWFARMMRAGKMPQMYVIAEVPNADARRMEKHYIGKFRSCGEPILNTDVTLFEMELLARHYAGECLSQVYNRGTDNLKWRCARGHLFFLSAARVKRGQWCPRCEQREAAAADTTLCDLHVSRREILRSKCPRIYRLSA